MQVILLYFINFIKPPAAAFTAKWQSHQARMVSPSKARLHAVITLCNSLRVHQGATEMQGPGSDEEVGAVHNMSIYSRLAACMHCARSLCREACADAGAGPWGGSEGLQVHDDGGLKRGFCCMMMRGPKWGAGAR